MIKYICLFIMFLMPAVTLLAQPDPFMFYHKTYTTDDGLSSRYIEDIYQDSRQYIWVSSDYGVNRFDGQKFEVYNQGKYRLQSDNINQIREDQAGNIWFISRKEQNKNNVSCWTKVTVEILDQQQDRMVSVKEYFKEKPPFLWSEVIYILQDNTYKIWITTKSGKVYTYTDHFVEIPLASSLAAGDVLYPLMDSGFLILGSGKISKLDSNLQLIYQIAFPNSIKDVFSTSDGQVFLTDKYSKVLFQIDQKGQIGLFEEINETTGEATSANRFGIDARGRVWIEEGNGKLSIYENGKRIRNNDLDKFSLAANGNYRISFVGDRSGGVWYSDINGLNYLSFNESGFNRYMDNASISMRGLYKLTDSTFFTNTYSGYFGLNKNTGYFEPYELDGFLSFSQGGIRWNEYLYNTMYGAFVVKINLAEQTFKYVDLVSGDPYINSKTFTSYPNGLILVGSNSGLFTLDPVIDTITPYNQYNEFNDLKNLIINSFDEVGDQIYISTDNGIYVLDWEEGIVGHHEFEFNHLLYLHQDDDGVNWIATRGGGLLEWHPEDNSLTRQYTTNQGFSHDIIYAVYEGANNELWLPSTKGLMCFNKKDKTVITYYKTNGLTSNEFNQYAHFQDTDGIIYFGGVNGLIAFDPFNIRQFSEVDSNSPIIITDITVVRNDNKTYNVSENRINKGEVLILKGDIQSASLKFSLLEYDRLEINQFFYKIDGIHDTWKSMDNHHVRLNGLPGGTHTIDIMVHAGIKMKTIHSSIKVQVLRPFTETWLFFGICALTFLAIGISLSRYRIYRLDQINQHLEKKVKKRTKKIEDDKVLISQQYREMEQINKTKDHLIAIIGHDLKDYVSTFEGIEQKINFLISSKQVERIPQLVEFIENSAHDLSLLLDNLLNWALKERGDLLLHPDTVSVKSILQDVLKRLDKSISKKEIVLSLDIPEELRMYVDGLTLHSLLRNIIHNAIKFSYRKGIIKIYHTEEDDFVTLHIEDRGIGMTAHQINQVLTDKDAATSTRGTENELGTGMGLLLCREMLEMQSGLLRISNKTKKGTIFSIRLPNRIPSNKAQPISV